MGKLIDVKSEEEMQAALAAATGQVAIEFIADGCGPCEDEKPKVEALAARCEGLTVLRINVAGEFGDKLSDSYGLEGTPTIYLAKSAAELKPGVAKELDDVSALSRKMKCAKGKR